MDSVQAILNVGVLVFREGLECVLVLASITPIDLEARSVSKNPIIIGVVVGCLATLLTWDAGIHVVADISTRVAPLALQATTGLFAVIVLLIVMNWFFHRIYWTGWISAHNARRRVLLERLNGEQKPGVTFIIGMGLLGFSSFYREGVEVVLFLQPFRLKAGNGIVLRGVCIGTALSVVVAIATFVMRRKLPYKKMLIVTGVLLSVVLVTMVGEQIQEMQLAHWISTTRIGLLANRIPAWMQLWFSVFPNVETIVGQGAALFLVLGSYFSARRAVGAH
jgi:high-affinity iron transporter